MLLSCKSGLIYFNEVNELFSDIYFVREQRITIGNFIQIVFAVNNTNLQ